MKKTIVLSFLISIFFICLLYSCKKSNQPIDNCAAIQKVVINGAKNSYYVGDTISLNAGPLPPIALFEWFRDIDPSSISGDNTLFIYPCKKSDEGWYYVSISYPDCASKVDSVYIAVHNPPATAPCSPATNTISFSSIPSVNVGSTSWGMDVDWNCKNLSAPGSGGYPDFNIYFQYYWNDKEPEDGAYDISNTITFDDGNPYSVFMSSTYSSIYFQANPGKVYVSHVNGKIQVTFCNIVFSGSLGGPTYTTSATGNLSAP